MYLFVCLGGAHTYMQRPEEGTLRSVLLFIYAFESGSLPEPGACVFSARLKNRSPGNRPVSVSLSL